MEATHFHDDHQMIVRNRAWAYAPDPEGAFGLKNSIPDFDVVGATSLFTTAHELAAWAELGTDCRLAIDDGRLVFVHRKLESRPLTPTFQDAFLLGGASAVFTRTPDGEVTGFSLCDGRVWNVAFDRVG
jgi:hypothetical protein